MGEWKPEGHSLSVQLRISGWHLTADSSACPAEAVLAVLGKKEGWLAGLFQINPTEGSVCEHGKLSWWETANK